MKKFGVIGHPAAHSLSPLLHGRAYEIEGLECSYEAFDVHPTELAEALGNFRTKGFAGLNVTLPHKEAVARLVQSVSDEAKRVGAVNTIFFQSDGMAGANTDVYGFAASIQHERKSIDGGKALVIGAGGSARAVLYSLLTEFTMAEIVVSNRTQARGTDLVRDLREYARGTSLSCVTGDPAMLRTTVAAADLVVNCTSLGLSPRIHECPVDDGTGFRSGQVVVDLIYTPLRTRFLQLAAERGARTISGLEMFIHQGARSFELWLGRRMPVDLVRPVIINELTKRQNETAAHS